MIYPHLFLLVEIVTELETFTSSPVSAIPHILHQISHHGLLILSDLVRIHHRLDVFGLRHMGVLSNKHRLVKDEIELLDKR